jgi:hypothetical protein
MARDIILRCVFRPYAKGMGPVFTLTMWDTGRAGYGGKWLLGYRLTMTERFNAEFEPARVRTVLFEGEDFGCSPLHAIDSDATVEGIMAFLTLRPGDTDADYFANYTPAQRDYCALHAEALSCEVQRRFCDENGNVR